MQNTAYAVLYIDVENLEATVWMVEYRLNLYFSILITVDSKDDQRINHVDFDVPDPIMFFKKGYKVHVFVIITSYILLPAIISVTKAQDRIK